MLFVLRRSSRAFNMNRQLFKTRMMISNSNFARKSQRIAVNNNSSSSIAIGSTVHVIKDPTLECTVFGRVVDKRKGWYSVETLDKIIKARASDLVVDLSYLTNDTNIDSECTTSNELQAGTSPIMAHEDSTCLITTISEPLNSHRETKKWVIFSDLHVKAQSIGVCEEVLASVHSEAVKHEAGIAFLGDFWHIRGSLNVELLNRILRALRKWTQPVIMIPGNHDQVSLGGSVHALEPLLYAFAPGQALLFSEPTLYLGALWLPYRRDHELLRLVLKEAGDRVDAGDIGAIFCHADVRGALMNDCIRSRDGLDASYFPVKVPIYSGHFHKPHTVSDKGNGAQIRYVGSPYQTSLAESGQQKLLYCLEYTSRLTCSDRVIWREVDRWPIDHGGKFLKVTSPMDATLKQAKPGDKVVMAVGSGEESAAQLQIQSLKSQGIQVELRHTSNPLNEFRNKVLIQSRSVKEGSVSDDLFAQEDLSAVAVFNDYLDNCGTSVLLSGGGPEAQLRSQVITEGQSIIDRLSSSIATNRDSLSVSEVPVSNGTSHGVTPGPVFNLELDTVSLNNFGPFGGKKAVNRYPLSRRGLVLLKGHSTDGTGADSNGCGKTTLAMSAMWCLTGSLDPRLINDNRPGDVVFDATIDSSGDTGDTILNSCKRKSPVRAVAEVTVEGKINSKPFSVTRRRGARKAELFFEVNGKDMTTLSLKDTQAAIDSVLGIRDGLLQRCCFFGQHSHTLQSLLGLSDAKLKSELSTLVNADIWIVAAQEVRKKEREHRQELLEWEIERRVREEELNRRTDAASTSQADLEYAEHELNHLLHAIQNRTASDVNSTIISSNSSTEMGEDSNSSNICDIDAKLATVRLKLNDYRRNKIPNLHKNVTLAARLVHESAAVDKTIATLQAQLAALAANEASNSTNQNRIVEKIHQVENEARQLNSTIIAIIDRINTAQHAINSDKNSSFRDIQRVSLDSRAFSIDNRKFSLAILSNIDAMMNLRNEADISKQAIMSFLGKSKAHLDVAVQSLEQLQCMGDTNIAQPYNTALGAIPNAYTDDAAQCPSCGQNLPYHIWKERMKTLQSEVAQLTVEYESLLQTSIQYCNRHESVLELVQNAQRMNGMKEALSKLRNDTEAIYEDLKNLQHLKNSIIQELQRNQDVKVEMKQQADQASADAYRQLAASEKVVADLEAQEERLITKLGFFRQRQEKQLLQKAAEEAAIAILRDRMEVAKASVIEAEKACKELNDSIDTRDKSIAKLSEEIQIFELLGHIFGPRGIQNYIYIKLVAQIEAVTNAYLQMLTDGGIKLALHSDALFDANETNSEKILKSVWTRSKADGLMRERALSSLSGGQWRRVSFALDLAFAEVVRRRGALRCNLIVMDEILTHLDSSGREAVSTVLRLLVQGPAAFMPLVDTTETLEGNAEENLGSQSFEPFLMVGAGAYDTVLVILQDLAAAELQEAFDQIDTVYKESDSAVVAVDGILRGVDEKKLSTKKRYTQL